MFRVKIDSCHETHPSLIYLRADEEILLYMSAYLKSGQQAGSPMILESKVTGMQIQSGQLLVKIKVRAPRIEPQTYAASRLRSGTFIKEKSAIRTENEWEVHAG